MVHNDVFVAYYLSQENIVSFHNNGIEEKYCTKADALAALAALHKIEILTFEECLKWIKFVLKECGHLPDAEPTPANVTSAEIIKEVIKQVELN